jgi:hypothetical protein
MSRIVIKARGPIAAIACLFVVTAGFLIVWRFQADRMKQDFCNIARAGGLEQLPPDLREKKWTDHDLASVEVILLDATYGVERATLRLMHTRGKSLISERQYAYQATVTDFATGIRYVFGYRRNPFNNWQYVLVHPESAAQYVQQHVRDHPVPAR